MRLVKVAGSAGGGGDGVVVTVRDERSLDRRRGRT